MIRRHSLSFKNGFTIVELLVVIVVIGILATVVAVAYNGIQSSARDKSVLSDLDALDGIQTQYGIKNSTVGKAWYSGSGSDIDINFTPSTGNVIDIVINSTDYCIRGYNPSSSTYKTLITAAKKESTNGICNSITASALARAASPSPGDNGGVVTLLAGSSYGYAEGTGSVAQFRYPYGIALDSAGVIYIADHSNHKIRKITPSGTTSFLAGSTFGYTNATGAAAQFEYPLDIAVDSIGNAFVVEENYRVRKVTPGGVVTTFAGSSSSGYVDADGTSARFGYTTSIAVDGSDNVFVNDQDNKRIRKITPSGTVTTFAGSGVAGYADGVGTAAQFGAYNRFAADNSGNVFVADSANKRIRKITPSGTVTTFAGSGVAGYADGVGTAAQFKSFGGIAVDSDGVIYVADEHRIRMIMTDGTVTTLAGSTTSGTVDGTGTTARFNWALDVTVNSSGTLYVSEEHRVRKIE